MGKYLNSKTLLPIKYCALVTLTLGLTLTAFQNCGKSQPAAPNVDSNQYTIQSTEDVNKVTIHMEPFINNPELITHPQYRHVHSIEVSLLQKTYRALDVNNDGLGPILPLKELQSQNLEDLFKQASVCKPLNKSVSPESICTMEFRLAYADLHDPTETVSLGQSENGCVTPVDLCGDDASLLKSYLKELVEDYFHSTQGN